MILKERDFKTYDLEADNAKEASKFSLFNLCLILTSFLDEICNRIRFLMQVTKGA